MRFCHETYVTGSWLSPLSRPVSLCISKVGSDTTDASHSFWLLHLLIQQWLKFRFHLSEEKHAFLIRSLIFIIRRKEHTCWCCFSLVENETKAYLKVILIAKSPKLLINFLHHPREGNKIMVMSTAS